jgi:hypothetical protein
MKRAQVLLRSPHRLTTLAALLSCLGAGAWAQSNPMSGSPSDVRYTPVQGPASALYPRREDDAAALAIDNGKSVARVVVEVDRDGVPADGQSIVKITLRLFDGQGRALTVPTMVTLEHSGGRLRLPGARTDEAGSRPQDADRVLPGVQVRVDRGELQFDLLAPHEAQDVRVRATVSGNSAGAQSAGGSISFVPDLRPMIAAGLIEGIVQFRRGVTLDPVRRGDAFEQEITAWSREFNGGKNTAAARAAFFLKGTVRGDVLLTAGYDSDKETRARLLRDIRPDAMYPVYGDASLRSFDARSGSRLYLRLDSGKSYALFGDFVTGDGFSQPIGQGNVASLQQRSLGQYNRTATGLRLHHETSALVGNLFVINDSLRQVVEEFASQGSGPYGLRNNAVLEGSEKVEVIVRDRQQPSRIVQVRPLTRLVDYSFEPFSGRILLAQFLGSVDADLNPVSLRVTYEVDQGGERFWVGGGDVQFKLGSAFEVGGSLVTDRNPLAGYDLASANATWRFGPRSAVVVEVARSRSEVNTNASNVSSSPGLLGRSGDVSGNAWRIEASHEGDASQARVFIGRSDPSFNNPAAPLNAGRGEAQASGKLKLSESFDLVGQALKSEDRNPGGGEQKLIDGGLRWRANDALTLELGLRKRQETVGVRGNSVSSVPFGSTLGLSSSIGSGSAGGALGYGNQALDPVSGLPLVNAGGGLQAAINPLPAGTRLDSDTVRLGLGWRINPQFTLGAEVEHEVAGDDRRRLAVGADYNIAERAKLYARWEHQSGWTSLQGVSATGSTSSALVLGVDTSYFRDTQLFSEYRLRDAISGRDLQLASGVRRQWQWSEGIGVSAGVERVQVLSGSTATATAASVGLEYAGSELWRGSTRLELRRSADLPSTLTLDERFSTTLWQVLLARKLDRDWTLLARNYLLHTDYRDRGDVTQNRTVLGVAYRDTDSNRNNALAKIEFKRESDGSNASVGELSTRATIVSLHADHHPSRPWWMSGRIAAKWQTDKLEAGTSSSFRAQLLSGRLTYDISERWDVGVAAAMQLGQLGARQTAYGAEVGYLLAENLWLSAGYNRSGFSADRDLAAYEYTQRGAYLRLRFKFDETLFKSGDREVNRSLDR